NYDREGYDWEGYDWEGYDYGGFDREGYDKEGYTRQDWEAAGYAFGPRGEFIMPESEDSSVLDQEELSEETIEELPLPDQAVPVHNDYANNLSNNEENEEGPTDNTGNELATKGRTERSSNSIEPDSVQLEPSDKTAYTEEESDGQLVHGLNSEQPEEGKPLTHNMKEAHQQTQGAEAQDKHKNKDYPQLEEPHEEEAYEEEDYHQDREEELQDEYQDEDYPQLEEPHEEEAYEEEDYHQDREEALQDEYQDEDYPQLEEPHEEEAYEEEDYHQNREEALQDEYQNKDYPQLEEPHEEEAHDEEDYHQNREEALQDEYQDEDYPQLEEPHEEEAYEEEDYHQAAVNPQSVDHDDILSYVAPQPSRTVPDSSPYVRSDIPVYDPQNSRFGSMTRPWSYECDYAIDYESGSRRGQRISLLVSEMGNERTLTIGSPGERVNDIEVDEPSIANDQALLRYSGGRFTLINFQEEDIKLNKRLVTCGEQVNLLTGDEITLGSTTLVFRERTTSEILEGYSIDVVEGTETDLGKSFPLLRQRSTIGRDRNSDIPLTDQEISRNHCTLAFRGGKFFLQHRSDTNPTFINGVSVPSGGERQITVSDKIKISSRTVLQLIKHT
ncbi:MAG: FHA domain-containing protein, partial [Candidatus Bruticola sp.]